MKQGLAGKALEDEHSKVRVELRVDQLPMRSRP
jgi:hypothetical protein